MGSEFLPKKFSKATKKSSKLFASPEPFIKPPPISKEQFLGEIPPPMYFLDGFDTSGKPLADDNGSSESATAKSSVGQGENKNDLKPDTPVVNMAMSDETIEPQQHLSSKSNQQKNNNSNEQVAQAEDATVSFTIIIEGKVSGAELIRQIEIQIFGQPINTGWTLNKISVDSDQKYGEDGKTVPYNVTVYLDTYRKFRAQSNTGRGTETKGSTQRAERFLNMPDSDDKSALFAEIDRRYYEAAGIKPGSTINNPEEEANNVTLWNVFRDEVLSQRELILNRSQKVKLLIPDDSEGIKITPRDYPKAIRLIEKIGALDKSIVEDYASRISGTTESLEQLEQQIDRIIENQIQQLGKPVLETLNTVEKIDSLPSEKYPQYLKVGKQLQNLDSVELETYKNAIKELNWDINKLETSVKIQQQIRSGNALDLDSLISLDNADKDKPNWEQILKDLIASSLGSYKYAPEVLGELWEQIEKHWPVFIASLVGIIVAEKLVIALAATPEPTFLTKALAIALQGLILALYGTSIAVNLGSAAAELKTWFDTAVAANGNPSAIKQASIAFLRAIGNLLLVILSSKAFQQTLNPQKLQALKAMLGRVRGRNNIGLPDGSPTLTLVEDPNNPGSFIFVPQNPQSPTPGSPGGMLAPGSQTQLPPAPIPPIVNPPSVPPSSGQPGTTPEPGAITPEPNTQPQLPEPGALEPSLNPEIDFGNPPSTFPPASVELEVTSPQPSEQAPTKAPPAGMSENLVNTRSTLQDPNAIEAFDNMWKQMGNDRMERAIQGMQKKGSSIEQRMLERWRKANPELTPYGPGLDQIPAVLTRAQNLKNEIQAFKDANPQIEGINEWIKRVDGDVDFLNKMQRGDKEATLERVQGLRNNFNGVEGELRFAQQQAKKSQVVGVNREFSFQDKDTKDSITIDADVVTDNGERLAWIDVKRVKPFGLGSSDWTGNKLKKITGLKVQAKRMLKMAEIEKKRKKYNYAPKVVFEFPLGVSREVAEALQKMQVEVRGNIIDFEE